MGVAARSKSSQRSPGRSTLSDLSDLGNATPRSSGEVSDEIENRTEQSRSPEGEAVAQLLSKPLGGGPKENQAPQRAAFARPETGIRRTGASVAKSSPLKRSDGIMNLDHANMGSPSAKRRSLHGATSGFDFDIFDHEAASQGFLEDHYLIAETTAENGASSDHIHTMSTLPRRTSSLRRTTLQQRHDKPNLVRFKPNVDLAHELATPGQSASKNRLRMSLDNFLPSMPRDSPFSAQGSLPNASAHLMSQHHAKPSTMNHPDRPQRHPLSRTITQSSSNSSMAEDSPSHIPLRHPEHRKPMVDFSNSLPIGAARPGSREAASSNPSSQVAGTEASFSTPENYRLARPLPAAFMSTGLISKKHKDMEDLQAGFAGGKSMMPDTPCKRQSIAAVSTPMVTPDVAVGKTRHARHSFGTPSTPFNPHASRPALGMLGKGVSIFGSSFKGGSTSRRGSFLGIETEDHPQSPGKLESQSSNDFDLPPTPTKQVTSVSEAWNHSPDGSSIQDFSKQSFGPSADSPKPIFHGDQHCKFLSVGTSEVKVDGDRDGNTEASPVPLRGFRNFSAVPLSFTRSRSLRDSRIPTPLLKKSDTVQFPPSNELKTKSSPLSPASPAQERREQLSPHTPRESMMPPDPSGLSISGHADRHGMGPSNHLSSASALPPATPTTSRDYSPLFGNGRLSLHASHNVGDVDPSLTSRFDKVELIGTGEFSHVYRVTKSQESKAMPGYFSLQTMRGSPQTPMPNMVWAVKKSRHAFIGPKDRLRKLQEVSTLKALGHSDHTVQFFNSWEEKNHLYIQTEFCEEGSLDLFLGQVGRKARLDDFRIWKIMLELSLVRCHPISFALDVLNVNQGLKHIHDSGFIHLDLKPANILITFEGVLKISDFGMASQWPAPPGIDGEGDREYIGPEILLGRFDKPSDIFALGLIMLEIAGNVMLPDNGTSWQRLRSGDMSDVPSLTWSSETSTILRDCAGIPLSPEVSVGSFYESDSAGEDLPTSSFLWRRREGESKRQSGKSQMLRTGELAQPPDFMIDANHAEALDRVVRWMISPEPANRPVVDEILRTRGVSWAESRRRAGATIYEGNWGPADEILADDAEMIDV